MQGAHQIQLKKKLRLTSVIFVNLPKNNSVTECNLYTPAY